MIKLGVGAVYKNLKGVRFWGSYPPWMQTPKYVALGYDVGKISAGCLVQYFYVLLYCYVLVYCDIMHSCGVAQNVP